MGRVVSMRRPIRIDGDIVAGDPSDAIIALLRRLLDACRTLSADGYRDVKIEIVVRGVGRSKGGE
jgi:hypothetical protein